MSNKSVIRHVILTGVPGIGKTTLVKKACEALRSKNVTINGFYTEEVRRGRQRCGFDVVMLDGARGSLARINEGDQRAGPQVGRYLVNVSSFEQLVLPLFLKCQDQNAILVLDEIGKMELYSETFKRKVADVFKTNETIVFATIPVPNKGKPIPLVEMIRKHPNAIILTVDERNRNTLLAEILDYLIRDS